MHNRLVQPSAWKGNLRTTSPVRFSPKLSFDGLYFFEVSSSAPGLYYFFESFGGVELLLSEAFSGLLLGGGMLVPPDGAPSGLLGALAPPGDGSCSERAAYSTEPAFTAGCSPAMTTLF